MSYMTRKYGKNWKKVTEAELERKMSAAPAATAKPEEKPEHPHGGAPGQNKDKPNKPAPKPTFKKTPKKAVQKK